MLPRTAGPIFVGGSGRSGTTILGRTLGLHPNIFSLPDEPKFLAAVPGNLIDYLHHTDSDQLRRRFEKAMKREFFRRQSPKGERSVGISTYVEPNHYRACLEQFLADFPGKDLKQRFQQVSNFVSALYGPTLTRESAERWCDDSPLTIVHALPLFQIFPDMRLIHVIRDGRHVAQSYFRLGWCASVQEGLRLWHSRVTIGRILGASLPAKNYCEVSLSAAVREPEPELRRILLFLDEPWSENMEHHRLSEGREAKHRGKVDRRAERLFFALAGSMVEEFGWEN